jgi:hypothetical protein
MVESLRDTKIQFINIELSLVHIPIALYTRNLHQILQLILPENGNWRQHQFINISINHIEASIILPKALATELFAPLVSRPDSVHGIQLASSIVIAPDDYILIWVDGATHSPSQRLIDLTTPLAMAKIPIFFITTYFSDYIVCPRRSKSAVETAFNAQGFGISPEEFNWSHIDSAPSESYSHRPTTSSSDSSQVLAPGTPPPKNLPELQLKTLSLLARSNIIPRMDPKIRLVQCGGRSEAQYTNQLLLSVIRLLLATPSFFSLTLAEGEQPSFLLEKRSLHLFKITDGTSYGNQSLLNGTETDVLIPLVLDLRTLPFESIGIVCGLAGRLVDATKKHVEGPVHMGYLSTTRTGAVMVMEDDLERTQSVFEPDVVDKVTESIEKVSI